MTNLEYKLYEYANDIVGNIGPSTETSKSVTEELYVSFVCSVTEHNGILPIWENWLGAYIHFLKHAKPEGEKFEENKKFTIYWRTSPEIKQNFEDGKYLTYARLLISWFNYDAVSCENNCRFIVFDK